MTGTTYIKNKTSVLNQTLKSYGDLSYLFHFIDLNPSFNSILSDILANTTINTDDLKITQPATQKAPNIVVSDLDIVAKQNQSIFDISTRYYGSLSSVIKLLQDNPNIYSINSSIVGLPIKVLSPNNRNKNVIYFNSLNSILTTAISEQINEESGCGRSFNESWSSSFGPTCAPDEKSFNGSYSFSFH